MRCSGNKYGRYFISLLFFAGFAMLGYSQDSTVQKQPLHPYLQVNYHSGTFWTRSVYLDHEFEDPYRALELRFGFHSTGNKEWQRMYNYPSYGLGMHYSDLVMDSRDTTVGNPFSMFAYYSAPIARFGRFTLASDISAGLSYMDRIYDPVTNPYNDVIASHINLYFDVNMNLSARLSPRIGVYGSAGLTHYSNGKIRVPQKGVNNWGWGLGMYYDFKPAITNYPEFEPPEFEDNTSIQFMIAAGIVEVMPMGGFDKYQAITYSFTADYVYQFGHRGAVSIGMDVLYDGSLAYVYHDVPPEEVTTWRKMYLASHMGYRYIIDRFNILFDFGTYFRQQQHVRGIVFARAGGRYYFTEHLAGHLCIKTKNGIRSDWIEWGLVAKLKIK